ncbi:protein of unknown function [Rhodovastum atsumiense]|nr:SDR family NAD(P)-dependent oxidoreductase [Rhodovastum atsumiense]CAH2603561.1 protein of unknown function [Rhodovastum atsumiense]
MTLQGKTVLVTGATSGIGRWTVLGLAQAGARVLAHGRDPARGEALRRFVTAQVPAARLDLLQADLSLLSEVRRLADEARALAPALDILVNNAGAMTKTREVTAEGHERILAVNHLAPFVLTQALLPALEAAAPGARIVNVGSAASDNATIRPDDLESTRAWRLMPVYGQSKLALMICSFELARRLGGRGITVNVVHPGVVATRIGDLGGGFGLLWGLAKPFLLSEERGAETTLRVAIDPKLADVTGRFFKKGVPVAPNRLALDQTLAGRVWTATERLVSPPA